MQAPVVPMSFLRAKPIGVMQMIDQGEQDDKIIAVHADDPEFRDYDDINQLPKHRLAEIRRWALQSRLCHAPTANMSLVAFMVLRLCYCSSILHTNLSMQLKQHRRSAHEGVSACASVNFAEVLN